MPEHIHHYLVSDVPVLRDGKRVLPGVCKYCHDEKDFPSQFASDFNHSFSDSQVSSWRRQRDELMADERLGV